MRPIPKVLLVNTIQYYELLKNGRYEGSFGAPVTITNVLINQTNTVTKTNPGNQEKATQGMLYIDAVNSVPCIELKYGSKIVDESGHTFYVKAIKPVQAFTLHHYEVTLM